MTTPPDELRELLGIAFECFPDGAAILALDGAVLYVNPAIGRMLGRGGEELRGHNLAEFVGGEERAAVSDMVSSILDGNLDHDRSERSFLRPDGTAIRLAVTCAVLRTPHGRPRAVLALCTELADGANSARIPPARSPLTTSPRSDEPLASALREELDSFCRTVSQQFRVPLRIIEGYAAIVVEDYGDALDEVAHRYMQTVRDQSQRLATMIDESLALARISSVTLTREKIDLSAIAADTAEIARAEAHARDVELRIEPGLSVDADPVLVNRLLARLFANAMRFSRQAARPRIEFGTSERGVFHVRDNGIGFDMASAPLLFQPFVTLHEGGNAVGAGTGLAEVKRIVAHHGGQVWAEAEPERGATFYFTLEAPRFGSAREGNASSPGSKL